MTNAHIVEPKSRNSLETMVIVQMLVDAGADPHAGFGLALHVAAKNTLPEVVRLLLQ